MARKYEYNEPYFLKEGKCGADGNVYEEWKNDQCGTRADTYIEYRFEQLCKVSASGWKILHEWNTNKADYIARIGTIVYDFQHFSRHDASHSVNILVAIEMLLGRKRVDLLSRGDLWLILESAYFHDIGMSLDYEKLLALWSGDEEFQKYIKSRLHVSDPDERHAAEMYTQMDRLVNNRFEMEKQNEAEKNSQSYIQAWPLQLYRAVILLTTGYIRKHHPDLAASYFNSSRETYIPARLYRLVVEIARLHGADSYDEIVRELKYCTKGVDSDVLHPRFVAALLRMGDVLDMDNNRFDMRAMEHFGRLPETSLLHYRKHQAMTHIAIRPNRIEAEAISDEYDVCRVCADWFYWVEKEEKDLIYYWGEIAPDCMGGCTLQRGSYTVYYGNRDTEFKKENQKEFKVDKEQFIKLVVGSNIYDGQFEFFREYLQNALDASKMRLWQDIKNGVHRDALNTNITNLRKLTPFDIRPDIYEQYPVFVIVDIDMAKQEVTLSIRDRGIGIDSECVDAISTIGSGWKKRERYRDDLAVMPDWLRPTGGFGIGIQSAFMITDELEITTRCMHEARGRKLIILNNPQKGRDITEEDCETEWVGTTITMKIALTKFQSHNYIRSRMEAEGEDGDEGSKTKRAYGTLDFQSVRNKNNYKTSGQKDLFKEDHNLDYIISLLRQFTDNLLVNSLFPVLILNSRRQDCKCRVSPLIKFENSSYIRDKFWCPEEFLFGGRTYRYAVVQEEGEDVFLLWEEERKIFAKLHPLGHSWQSGDGVEVAYKNVLIQKPSTEERRIPILRYFEGLIDVMGGSAKDVVKLSRSEFVESFHAQDVYRDLLCAVLAAMQKHQEKCLAAESESRKNGKAGQERKWADYEVYITMSRIYAPSIIWDNVSGQEVAAKHYNYLADVDSEEQKMASDESNIALSDFLKLLEEKENILFASHKKPEMYAENTIRLMQGAENDKEFKSRVLDQEYIITDPDIYQILQRSGDFEEKFYVTEWTSDTFVELHRKKSETETRISESEFYRKVYEDSENEGRATYEQFPEAYAGLAVDLLPFGTEQLRGADVKLISPMSRSVVDRLGAKVVDAIEKDGEEKGKLPRKLFMDEFLENEEYLALISWVTEHQAHTPRISVDKVKELYEKMLDGLYHFKYFE